MECPTYNPYFADLQGSCGQTSDFDRAPFSGRRRDQDFHMHLHNWAELHGCNVVVLSLDTAVSPYYGNLFHESVTWSRFLELLSSGCISGALTGSPCETFSAARFNPPPEDAPDGAHWPRLSDRMINFLVSTSCEEYRELRQLELGTCFFLQVIEVLCWLLRLGGGTSGDTATAGLSDHLAKCHCTGVIAKWELSARVHPAIQYRWAM